MADVSHLHEDDGNGHRHDFLVSVSPPNNHLPHRLDEVDVYPLDLDFSSSQDFFHRRTHGSDRIPPPISSLSRETLVSFVVHMCRQRVERLHLQSQSQPQPQPQPQSHSRANGISVVVEEKDDIISNEFEVDFGSSGSGFLLENYHNPNCDDDDDSGFMVADSRDDFFVPSLTRSRHVARSESGDSIQGSGRPEIYTGVSRVTDIGSGSDDARENEIIEAVDGDSDDEASLHLCWDACQLEDDITTSNPTANANDDFDWEEVDDRIDERETLSMFFGAEPDDDVSVLPVILTGFSEPSEEHELDALEWQVLSNVHNFESNPDSEDQYEEYNYTEYEMQFADSVVPSSGRPPASKTVVRNLSTVLMTQEDAVENNTLCAVCKDEIIVGQMATQLPCNHRFHGDCILPWLAIRNTCPVCRHELPTESLDYELRKVQRAGLA